MSKKTILKMKQERVNKQEHLKRMENAYMHGYVSKEFLYQAYNMPQTVLLPDDVQYNDGTIVDPEWYVKEVDGKLTKVEDM